METSHRRLNVGEVTLHVAEAGDPSRPLVVFLHGFPEFWWSWRHQLDALSDAGFWCVAPDLRGYNESDRPEGIDAYEIEKLVGDVEGLIRALGRESAIVVGHDWGAVIAWAFAQERPAMVERLAILNVPHPVTFMKGLRSFRQLSKSWYMFFFQLPLLPELAIAAFDYAAIRKGFEGAPKEEADRYVEAAKVPGAMKAAVTYYRAILRRVVRGRLPSTKRIEQPVLVIWGDRDDFLEKELAEPPPEWVPNARVVHVPEATHWVQNAAPERVNELLIAFARE